jgi:L-amino acid N-acyltransferase YncA
VPPPKLSTRLATPEDAAAIAAIYNEGIAERIATFETEPRTAEQIGAQLRDKGDRFPTIVAEHDGHIVAWAGAGPYRARPAYAGVAEHSVYVARAARGKGAGRIVLNALCRAYAERGFWRSCPGSFPRTPRAWCCTNVADSGSLARTSATASSRASGETVSLSSGCSMFERTSHATMTAMSVRADMAKLGERLQYATILWNSAECVVALVAGFVAGSIALVGFGFDSAIEVTSSVAAVWRSRWKPRRDRRACVRCFQQSSCSGSERTQRSGGGGPIRSRHWAWCPSSPGRAGRRSAARLAATTETPLGGSDPRRVWTRARQLAGTAR